ncbi:heparinase II/III domain-containing protein [Lacrimispora sphenoides]|uniref:Heparinase II/III-like protein n=1 Tax=Lacrimispora sphenoides JCM 1415 TaxID=1297793 RepID=A0ABY1CCD6_9FIRM|nr:heparinase II/III family protein [Lacrimispora sphenoides]SET91754.1 Heparinase II/III-like protein [[Clostridium] sphenoides JCM 1415]SUY52340.1 heparinase II/III family protein [Lacrimispora sphenoides]
MIQFTEQEIRHLREKYLKQRSAVNRIIEDVKEIMAEPVLVPKTGIANWTLYYYCPDCSVRLTFDRDDKYHHSCPSCGRVYSGEPYDSTWWGIINSRNYTAVFQMGLIHLITGEADYARKAVEIMMEYSRYYKDYEVHGNIPYNGPGKSGAQTLDEANFLRSFAMSYDLLSDFMTEEEKEFIGKEMLIPGAEFLMEHRHNQLHNHEVIISSAIAVIGLIFGIDRYIQFAVYEPYGILYQLENGVLPDHMWFEGALGYHFYALTSFFAYEKFALHTPHSHIGHPNYKAMMELLASYLEPGFRIPMLNDTNYGHTSSSLYLYEFAYRELGGEKLLFILNQLYEEEKRDNLEAFIYGAEELPKCSMEPGNYHVEAGQSGSTILRGKDERYLLIKHDRYGGEHDHYDRLGISYLAHGKRISPDLGTTGYGAVMHYDFYKNTGSHNTVNIDGDNQAPVNARLTRYEEKDGGIYVEAEADWTKPYEMPDSFTIVQWKEETYRPVKMVRKIAWEEDYFAEVFQVKGAGKDLPVDWVMHFSGNRIKQPEGMEIEKFSDRKPYSYLHHMKKAKLSEDQTSVIHDYEDGGIHTRVFTWNQGLELYDGMGPDNPSISDINYQIERGYGPDLVFAHVITSSNGPCLIRNVNFSVDGDCIVIEVEGEKDERKWSKIHKMLG